MFLVKIVRLYAGEGGKPAFYKTCDPSTFDKTPNHKEEAAQPDDRPGAENNAQASLGNLTLNIGVVLRASKNGMALLFCFHLYLGYGELVVHGSGFQRGCRHFASHPPVTAEIQAWANAMGPPVASNAPTKQATAHRPTKVESVPNVARAPVEILVSVVACATDLAWFLLFANDACVMMRLLPVG